MKILHFSDLHLGVENYGRLDPETGLSTRLQDFLAALDKLVDYALEDKVDLVLFCGDAYKTREPTQTQQREFAKRISRLASAGIPVFLLVGNHDLPNAFGRATTTEIFDTLAVKNVRVAGKPDVYKVPTAAGPLQIVALPWLRRSAMLNKEEVRELDFEQLKKRMEEVLTGIIAESAAGLDPSLPAVLAAHAWVSGARVGSENMMAIGQEPALLLSNVALPAFDYVALGHIHKHQVLNESPPVVYAGSLERVDFGEEGEEKGFYTVEIAPDPATGRRRTAFAFHPVKGRRFITINVSLAADDADPTATVLKAIGEHRDKVPEAVVRLNVTLPAEVEGQLRDGELRDALKEAQYLAVTREVEREARPRLGGVAAEEITPLAALQKYLEIKETPPERARVLLEYGEKLVRGREG